MSPRESFLERLSRKIEDMDANGIQAYILRLAREKGFLETIFNAIHEGIIVIDRRLRIKYFNRAAKDLLGLPEDCGRVRISQFLREIDWKGLLQEDEDAWYRVSRQEIEVLYPVRRILQFYLVPQQDKSETATIILHDVTESRASTERVIETERTRMISLLAAGVAHEIGNPLNSLYLHLQLLQRHCLAEKIDPNEMGELLNVAKSEVERLDSIVNQFLRAIRPARPDFAPLDLKELIVEALNFMRHEIEGRAVEVKCGWPDFLPKINGDAAQLKQAFYNLIKNALQAMPNGGVLEINCGVGEDGVRLAFSDTGVGIGADDISKIFEPYQTSKKEGSGLGLVIVERIIRDHGAELSVDSSPGKGTIFNIHFPPRGRRLRVLPAPPPEEIKAVDTVTIKPRRVSKK